MLSRGRNWPVIFKQFKYMYLELIQLIETENQTSVRDAGKAGTELFQWFEYTINYFTIHYYSF